MINYFIVDGEKYYTGTIFIIEDYGKHVEASFICYDTERSKYIYKIKECIWHTDEHNFRRTFVRVTNKRDESAHMPVTKTINDSEIDGLFIGWIWYIFFLMIGFILNGAIIFWALISIAFFSWRKDKIKKEGTYIEW